ncbi:MAG: hypothetical protein GXP09_10795 [Gammaproteobacteria bacterium]|nr:hypothetical protein [Gammaproteobacteria bacterium]
MRSPKEVKELFLKAEGAIALFEGGSRFSVAAANELRYAGKHLAEYIAADDDASKKKYLQRAAQHCERALRDVAEAIDVQALASPEEERRLDLLEKLKDSAAVMAGITSLVAAMVVLLGGF